MRERRLRWLLALAGLAVMFAAVAVALWPRPNRITRENYARIKLGMSRSQVRAILGSPYDYTYGIAATGYVRPEGDWCKAVTSESWTAKDCEIWMHFDCDGNVTAKSCGGRLPGPVSLLDKVRWHLWRLTGHSFP
jgi:SmpA / OmlA family